MKRFAIALTSLALATGAASAASLNQINERPDTGHVVAEAAETVQVPAYQVMTAKERARAGIAADELLTVTKLPTIGAERHVSNSDR